MATSLPQDLTVVVDVTRIKADTYLVALIQSRGVALKQQGRDRAGFCPFHDDSEQGCLDITPRFF